MDNLRDPQEVPTRPTALTNSMITKRAGYAILHSGRADRHVHQDLGSRTYLLQERTQ